MSHENTITVEIDGLNGGAPTNIPTVIDGQQLADDAAIAAAVSSGDTFRSFETMEDAVAAARARSESFEESADAFNAPGERLSGENDLEARYADHRSQRARSALLEEARARIAARETASIAAAEPPSDDDEIPPGQDPDRPRPTGRLRPALETAGRELDPDKRGGLETPLIGLSIALAKNVMEVPLGVVRGLFTGVGFMFEALDDLAEWLNDNVADLKIPVEKGSAFDTKPLAELAQAAKDIADAVPKRRTAAGKIAETIAQFLGGFRVAGVLAKVAGIGKATTKGGQVADAALRGAFADAFAFDPDEQNLSALIEQSPSLANPITEFLATAPDDTTAEQRFKKAVEGVGLGVLADGLFLGVKFYRDRRVAARRLEGDEALADARARFGEVADEDLALLGRPEDELVVVEKMRSAEAATEATDPGVVAGRAGEPAASGIRINFARIDTADDVKDLIRRTVDLFAGDVDVARRGVRSNEATQEAADALGMTVEDVLRRRGGQPLNAEESLAARRLWAASADKLIEAAERATAPNAGAVDQFVFRKMMAVHYAIQAEVIGARTETARALQAWRIPVGGIERARAIQNLLDGAGGERVSRAMAKNFARLRAADASPQGFNVAIRKGAFARTMDAVRESFVLGLLWSPKTHLVNIGSNTIVAFQQIMERGAAAQNALLIGREASEGGVVPGEGLAMAYGLISGLKDAFRMAGRSLVSGDQLDALGKIDIPREAAISSDAFNIASETGLGRAVDFIGFATRTPARLLGSEDAFFKSIGYRMELHAQALRQATQEGHAGEALGRRMQEIVTNPPENIRIGAADAALYNTFTNVPGDFTRALLGARNTGSLNPFYVLIPFIRTPANILRYAFERSPIAPLVGQWRADIAAGGARADIALARMATGSAIMAVLADYAYSGYISGNGPKDPGKRGALTRQGWQRNAIWRADPDNTDGGTWINYNRLDPFGNAANFAAGMSEIMKTRDLSPEDMDEAVELMAMATAAVSSSVVDKSYFQGVSNILMAIEEPERRLQSFFERTLASFVPFSTAINTARQIQDPKMRDANGAWQQIMARLPGFSERLPLALDLWGRERGNDQVYGRAFDVLSPLYATSFKDSPIDAEITRLQIGIRRIPKKATFKGVDVNFRDWPRVYEQFVRLAGNALKHPVWNLGAHDFLNDVVAGRHQMSEIYNFEGDGKDGGKSDFIRDTIRDFRRLAQDALLADPKFTSFLEHVEAKRAELENARLPAALQGAITPTVIDRAGGSIEPPLLR